MLDTFANYTLYVTKPMFLIVFLIVGLLGFQKRHFGEALFLLMITMALNAYLKSVFAVPLLPKVGTTGYAFPSGHMATAVVFWGWLMLRVQQTWFTVLAGALICAIGFSLWHLGYHTPMDIGGALVVGVLMVLLAALFLIKLDPKDEGMPLFGLLLACCSTLLIMITPGAKPEIWMSPGILALGSIGWWIQLKSVSIPNSYLVKLFALVFGLVGAVGIFYAKKYIGKSLSPKMFYFIVYGAMAFWVFYFAEKCALIATKPFR